MKSWLVGLASVVSLTSVLSGVAYGSDTVDSKIDQKQIVSKYYGGEDRYKTSINVSKSIFKKAESVIIASGGNFADSLSSVNLSQEIDSPILISKSSVIDSEIVDEIKRLGAKNVYVVGGQQSISYEAVKGLKKDLGEDVEVVRISGSDRYRTNDMVIDFIDKNISSKSSPGYVVVSGKNFSDAISAVGVSKSTGYRIKLVSNSIDGKYNLQNNILVGGEKYLGINGLKGERISGEDRYDTSVKVAEKYFSNSSSAIVTSGENFSDAIVASSLVKNLDSPIILMPNKNYSMSSMNYIKNNISSAYIVGGAIVSNYKNTIEENNGNYFVPMPIDESIKSRIMGKSFKQNDLITFDDLSYIKLLHIGFDGKAREGEIIVNKSLAGDVSNIFRELYNNRVKIEKIRLVDEYDADDLRSMEDNNSSSFNYRVIKGTNVLSNHGKGAAIDINPKYNPHVVKGVANPASSQMYADRSIDNPYYIKEGDTIYNIFSKYGWEWGGEWPNPDYQHFEKSE